MESSPLPEHLHAVPKADSPVTVEDEQPAGVSASASQGGAVLYIDTDNQSAQLGKPLLDALGDHFNRPIAAVVIAGNNAGKRLDQWQALFAENDPAVPVQVLDVPPRKEAADIALIMQLGSNLEQHIRERQLVIVMSRDHFLIGAAEQARSRGARVLLAYGDSAIPSCEHCELTTLLLPSISKSPPTTPTAPAGEAVETSAKISTVVPKVDRNSVQSVVAGLRQMCPEQAGGGFQATHVGQALAKMGFSDAKDRKQFLKSVPNLTTRGEASKKRLLF